MDRAHAIKMFDALVASNSRIERKGDTMPYTSHNGHMFSVLTKEGHLALRLPEPVRSAFLKKYKTTIAEQYGHTMPEYVLVPDTLLENTSELKRAFAESFAYVARMGPKPARKGK